MNLGYIDYLNCYPFYFEMLDRTPIDGVSIIPAYPRELNRMMEGGELQMSPISSAAYARMDDRTVLLPEFCLSSVGYVGSVVLRSKIPIEELDGRRVGVTRASETSVALLKAILKQYYGIEPAYETTEPNPYLLNLDAALIIGNEAMAPVHEPVSFSYDLGDLWLRKTGFPVVFAVFAIQEDALDTHQTTIDRIVESYRRSLALLENKQELVIAGAQRRYPGITYDLAAYYRTLKFSFSPELKDALQFYFHLTGGLGILKAQTMVHYRE